MSSIPPLLVTLFPLGVSVIVLLVGAHFVKHPHKRKVGAIVMLVALPLLYFTGMRVYHQVKARWFLATLKAADVKSIALGSQEISADSVPRVVKAMQESYFSHPSKAKRSATLSIKLKSGDSVHWQVSGARQGVIVGLTGAKGEKAGMFHTYLHLPNLKTALQQTGVTVPWRAK